jgi:hypothetical protein
MILSAYLKTAGLSDIGYRFYNADESANGARITAGVVDAGGGWYSVANASVPANAASVRWNSAGTPSALAREYFAPVVVDAVAIADAILVRDWTLVSGEAGESVLNALRSIRNKWTLDLAGNLTVYKENGTTVAWTRTVTTDANSIPVTGMS